jgi:Bacterial SH3 domain
MVFRKSLVVGLLSVGALIASALPGMARPATITIEANVRSAASLEARVLDGLPVGTNVEVLNIFQEPERYQQQQHTWYYLRSSGRVKTEGWVRSELVNFGSTSDSYGTLSADRGDAINIRSAPTTQGKVLRTGITGDLVTVGRSMKGDGGKRWYYVTYPNRSAGWVREDLISIAGD